MSISRRWSPWSGLLALVFATACSSSSGDVPAIAWQSVPEEQRAALEDGVVTRAEIEGAYQGGVECLEDAGFIDVFYERESDRVYAIQASSGARAPNESEDEMEARLDVAFEACLATHVGTVGDQWLRQTEISEEERLQAADHLRACIEPWEVEVLGIDAEGLRPLNERIVELENAGQVADAAGLNACYRDYLLVAGGSPAEEGDG